MTADLPEPDAGDPTPRFLAALRASLADGRFVKLVLAKPRKLQTAHGDAAEADLLRTTVRAVTLRGEAQLSFVHTHRTRDVTKNLPLSAALAHTADLLSRVFGHAHLLTADEDVQLLVSKKGKATLLRHAAEREAAPTQAHDRAKQRTVDVRRPFLTELGVTTRDGQVVPAMARKWKQINKFVEVFSHALDASPLSDAKQVRVADFGSGKGYLTFAVHDHLRHVRGVDAQVTGVELRPDMVALGNAVIDKLGLDGLRFDEGDVRSHTPGLLNVVIALHACDTATDHAIHLGVKAGADIILCSPCCHKEVRPQLLSPHPLRPLLQHGVHLGQQAEMLTDGLRAMLLDACGYETQVFEFVSLEHTNKNKMILGVRRAAGAPLAGRDAVMKQIDDLKGFYGVRDQCLEALLRGDGRLG